MMTYALRHFGWIAPALLIAALSANGTSRIANIAQIDRGYENIEARLNALGAKITRVND